MYMYFKARFDIEDNSKALNILAEQGWIVECALGHGWLLLWKECMGDNPYKATDDDR